MNIDGLAIKLRRCFDAPDTVKCILMINVLRRRNDKVIRLNDHLFQDEPRHVNCICLLDTYELCAFHLLKSSNIANGSWPWIVERRIFHSSGHIHRYFALIDVTKQNNVCSSDEYLQDNISYRPHSADRLSCII